MSDTQPGAGSHEPLDEELQRLLEFAASEVGAPISFTSARSESGKAHTGRVGGLGQPLVPVAGRWGTHGTLQVGSKEPLEPHEAKFLSAVARLVADRRDRAFEHAARLSSRIDRIDRILSGDAVDIVYQPIIDLRTGSIVGVEALSRFHEGTAGPEHWFLEATEVGRGLDLEVRAISKAIAAFADLPEHLYVSVNVSPDVAMSPELHRRLRGLPLDRLVFEITEHAQVADYDGLNAALRSLRKRGLRLAVDDAGAGFASLRHILRIQPDIIKLDVSLIRGIDRDSVLRALSYSISSFGAAVDAKVIAEGVETEGEYHALRFLRVDFGQGFLLHEPVALERIDLDEPMVSPTTPV